MSQFVRKQATRKGNVVYRDSALTHVLKPVFEDVKSNFAIILALSPSVFNIRETVNTLRFGQRCTHVKKASPNSSNKNSKGNNNNSDTESKEQLQLQTTDLEAPLVYVRLRPCNSREISEGKTRGRSNDQVCPVLVDDKFFLDYQDENIKDNDRIGKKIECKTGKGTMRFDDEFTNIFADTSQLSIFETIGKPLVNKLISKKNENGCIMAYGQTGAGKTHTIIGSQGAMIGAYDDDDLSDAGLVPHISKYIFSDEFENVLIQNGIENCDKSFAMFEIYLHNQIRDTLHPKKKGDKPLRICDAQDGTVFVKNMKFENVKENKEVLQLAAMGNSNRFVSRTKMNAISSRSHTFFIFQFNIACKDGKKSTFRLSWVDLSGSEVVGKTGATGQV